MLASFCYINYTFCVVTHKAQNHHHHAMVIDDWVGYINQLIAASAYNEHCIVNFDETNVDFDPSHRNTLCKVREKSTSLRINGHSGRCTVMLGCSAGGHKSPPFIIWKGVRGGRIHHDCGMQVFKPGQIYTVQPAGWMDRQAFNKTFLVLRLNLSQLGTILYCRQWIKGYINPLNNLREESLAWIVQQPDGAKPT
jgi:hypothetical protein